MKESILLCPWYIECSNCNESSEMRMLRNCNVHHGLMIIARFCKIHWRIILKVNKCALDLISLFMCSLGAFQTHKLTIWESWLILWLKFMRLHDVHMCCFEQMRNILRCTVEALSFLDFTPPKQRTVFPVHTHTYDRDKLRNTFKRWKKRRWPISLLYKYYELQFQ